MKPSRNVNGFTLIELLVAMLVFSLLAIAGYHGLQSVLDTRNHLDAETRKYQDLGQFFSRLEGQLAQASRRPAHLRDGREQSAFVGFASDASGLQDAQVLFTRGGGVDATGGWIAPQRVGYRLRNHAVELLRWDHLDQAPNAEPKIDVVLQGVREFELRYLSLSLVWEKQWTGSAANVPLPKAVEVLLLLDSGEKLLRVMDLP
jgi:general secretion pathway protein J